MTAPLKPGDGRSGQRARRLGIRRLRVLRVLADIGESATISKVRFQGRRTRQWGDYSLLGEDLSWLVDAGYVSATKPVVRGGIYMKPVRYRITDAGRDAMNGALVRGDAR